MPIIRYRIICVSKHKHKKRIIQKYFLNVLWLINYGNSVISIDRRFTYCFFCNMSVKVFILQNTITAFYILLNKGISTEPDIPRTPLRLLLLILLIYAYCFSSVCQLISSRLSLGGTSWTGRKFLHWKWFSFKCNNGCGVTRLQSRH